MSFNEEARKWVQITLNPPQYLIASLIVSIGGLLNGLDTGVIGPVTTMPMFIDYFGNLSSSTRGIVVSSVLLSATFASLFAGWLSDAMGRARAVAIGSLVFALGAGLEAGSVNLAMLILGRVVVGLGEGLFLSTLVLYICEISPPSRRGPLASMVQIFITIGLCIGYFMCYGTVRLASSISWRLPLAVQSGLALALAVASLFYLPESPRWLTYKGRTQEPSVLWDRLGVTDAEREKNLAQTPIPTRIVEDEQVGLRGRWRRTIEGLRRILAPDTRKQMILGVFVMSMQQLSGIDGVLYYAPLLFQQAGLSSSKASFFASGVSAILIFVSSIPALIFVDRLGRRGSTIYGGLVVSLSMALIGSLYASDGVHQHTGAGRWIVIVTIYIFAVAYCTTWALSIKIFASEIQPTATRATATSIAQSANCITNFFVAFITPVLLAKSSSGIYFLFAGASLFTVGVCAIYMQETRGHSLENINESFGRHVLFDGRTKNRAQKAVGHISKLLTKST